MSFEFDYKQANLDFDTLVQQDADGCAKSLRLLLSIADMKRKSIEEAGKDISDLLKTEGLLTVAQGSWTQGTALPDSRLDVSVPQDRGLVRSRQILQSDPVQQIFRVEQEIDSWRLILRHVKTGVHLDVTSRCPCANEPLYKAEHIRRALTWARDDQLKLCVVLLRLWLRKYKEDINPKDGFPNSDTFTLLLIFYCTHRSHAPVTPLIKCAMAQDRSLTISPDNNPYSEPDTVPLRDPDRDPNSPVVIEVRQLMSEFLLWLNNDLAGLEVHFEYTSRQIEPRPIVPEEEVPHWVVLEPFTKAEKCPPRLHIQNWPAIRSVLRQKIAKTLRTAFGSIPPPKNALLRPCPRLQPSYTTTVSESRHGGPQILRLKRVKIPPPSLPQPPPPMIDLTLDESQWPSFLPVKGDPAGTETGRWGMRALKMETGEQGVNPLHPAALPEPPQPENASPPLPPTSPTSSTSSCMEITEEESSGTGRENAAGGGGKKKTGDEEVAVYRGSLAHPHQHRPYEWAGGARGVPETFNVPHPSRLPAQPNNSLNGPVPPTGSSQCSPSSSQRQSIAGWKGQPYTNPAASSQGFSNTQNQTGGIGGHHMMPSASSQSSGMCASQSNANWTMWRAQMGHNSTVPPCYHQHHPAQTPPPNLAGVGGMHNFSQHGATPRYGFPPYPPRPPFGFGGAPFNGCFPFPQCPPAPSQVCNAFKKENDNSRSKSQKSNSKKAKHNHPAKKPLVIGDPTALNPPNTLIESFPPSSQYGTAPLPPLSDPPPTQAQPQKTTNSQPFESVTNPDDIPLFAREAVLRRKALIAQQAETTQPAPAAAAAAAAAVPVAAAAAALPTAPILVLPPSLLSSSSASQKNDTSLPQGQKRAREETTTEGVPGARPVQAVSVPPVAATAVQPGSVGGVPPLPPVSHASSFSSAASTNAVRWGVLEDTDKDKETAQGQGVAPATGEGDGRNGGGSEGATEGGSDGGI
uniref:Uncharacterized protein n=2 Tax=Chromera velia CCMP2878 TaxID=1169474 RepID=A0A0G4H9A2_9ALVE|eukprot:Cvel_25376.t1-p1 / transcript=Cvel_25376.t1 / gene=Cvel_25376 / organism=Chromera_velia_CCMP2878 / gene_product=hypothetical protein / transcript_product=hypothetical protein / location=Cvel_scaffold2866:18974-22504(+) / protein_length=969 / sequence_SO=supercontig / SO=protein_coding / is_pseudo=false